jgi:hypothetical protein
MAASATPTKAEATPGTSGAHSRLTGKVQGKKYLTLSNQSLRGTTGRRREVFSRVDVTDSLRQRSLGR